MNNDTVRYWVNISKRAFSRTKKWFGIREIIIDFIIAGVGTVLYHKFRNVKNFIPGEIAFGLIVFIGLFLLIFCWKILVECAILDKEQKIIIAKNNLEELKVGVGYENSKYEEGILNFLEFQSMYNSSCIKDMYVQITHIYCSKFFGDKFFVKSEDFNFKEIFYDTKYIGKNLKYYPVNVSHDQTSLMPGETNYYIFIEESDDSEALQFGYSTIFDYDDIKNNFRNSGTYEVYIDVYGRIDEEKNFRKLTFIAFINFISGKGVMDVDVRNLNNKYFDRYN